MISLNFHPEIYNKTAYIVGGGPSLIGFDWNTLGKDKFVVAVNRSYEVLPDAQIVYFTDDDWYKQHEEGLLEHCGSLIKGSINPTKLKTPDVIQYKLSGEKGLTSKPGELIHGRNSTYAAINLLAAHLGFNKIYLLGIDLKWQKPADVKKATKHNCTTHWHSGHTRIDPEAIYTTMKNNYQTIVEPLKKLNVEVINVNTLDGTDLRVFPIKSVEEVFGK